MYLELKVLERFRDKYTNEIHEVGSIIRVTKERADELLSLPVKFVALVGKASTSTVIVDNIEEETDTVIKRAPKKKKV
jgi:hypothetical protein